MTETKRLTKSDKDKVILGVCGGLAEYFEVDPVIVRVIFVLLALGNGFGVLIYIILAIALPSPGDPSDMKGEEKVKKVANDIKEKIHSVASDVKNNTEKKEQLGKARNLAGIILVFIGILALLNQFFSLHWIGEATFPALVVLFGAYLIFKK